MVHYAILLHASFSMCYVVKYLNFQLCLWMRCVLLSNFMVGAIFFSFIFLLLSRERRRRRRWSVRVKYSIRLQYTQKGHNTTQQTTTHAANQRRRRGALSHISPPCRRRERSVLRQCCASCKQSQYFAASWIYIHCVCVLQILQKYVFKLLYCAWYVYDCLWLAKKKEKKQQIPQYALCWVSIK